MKKISCIVILTAMLTSPALAQDADKSIYSITMDGLNKKYKKKYDEQGPLADNPLFADYTYKQNCSTLRATDCKLLETSASNLFGVHSRAPSIVNRIMKSCEKAGGASNSTKFGRYNKYPDREEERRVMDHSKYLSTDDFHTQNYVVWCDTLSGTDGIFYVASYIKRTWGYGQPRGKDLLEKGNVYIYGIDTKAEAQGLELTSEP